MALSSAINHLQRTAGADTRVTAPADAVAGGAATSPSHLIGVWRSWEGKNHDTTTGLPSAPDYLSKLVTGDDDFTSSDDGRFLGWLISGDGQNNAADSPPSLVDAIGTVPLLGESSVGSGNPDKEVHLIPTAIDNKGTFAYWIQGENTKSYLTPKFITPPADTDDIGWSRLTASNGLPDPASFGFDSLEDLEKGITQQTLDLVSHDTAIIESPSNKYHEITTSAKGLLTNTANGGWRRDLTLMAEKWHAGVLPATDLPVFSKEPYTSEHLSSLKLVDNPSNTI